MAIASEFLIWRTNGRLFCRVTTNVGLCELRARLAFIGLLECVEDIRAFFGDRVEGGSGYELLFGGQVTWDELRRAIVRL